MFCFTDNQIAKFHTILPKITTSMQFWFSIHNNLCNWVQAFFFCVVQKLENIEKICSNYSALNLCYLNFHNPFVNCIKLHCEKNSYQSLHCSECLLKTYKCLKHTSLVWSALTRWVLIQLVKQTKTHYMPLPTCAGFIA